MEINIKKYKALSEKHNEKLVKEKRDIFTILTNMLDEEALFGFFDSMQDRQLVWHNRHNKPESKNWSPHNHIFAKYKFTNVYRELDRCSQYHINTFISGKVPLMNENIENLLWSIILYRVFNVPELFDLLFSEGFDFTHAGFNQGKLYDTVKKFRISGGNPFTPAYLHGTIKCEVKGRDFSYCNVVIPEIHRLIPILASYIECNSQDALIASTVYRFIANNFPTCGFFMAHEFFLDMCYINKYKCSDASVYFRNFTENSMTNLGPGAERGIDLLFPDNQLDRIDKELGIYYITSLHSNYLKDFKYIEFNGFVDNKAEYKECSDNYTLHHTEMWLCEYQKYLRCKIGKGKQQTIYKRNV